MHKKQITLAGEEEVDQFPLEGIPAEEQSDLGQVTDGLGANGIRAVSAPLQGNCI